MNILKSRHAHMLSLQPILTNDYVLMEADMETGYLQVTILKQPSSDTFRENTFLMAQLALEKGISRALFDVRLRNYLSVSDQNWLLREIVPLFEGQNMRFAYLTTLQKLEMMDTFRVQEIVVQNADRYSNFILEHFIDQAEAQQWVLQ